MRVSSRYLLVFVAGLLIGGVSAGMFVASNWKRHFRDSYLMGVAGQAYAAGEIYAGRSKQLADRIRGNLPGYVHALEDHFPGGQGRNGTYWMVSDVYKLSETEVPTDLKPILASLPPRGSCPKPATRLNVDGAP